MSIARPVAAVRSTASPARSRTIAATLMTRVPSRHTNLVRNSLPSEDRRGWCRAARHCSPAPCFEPTPRGAGRSPRNNVVFEIWICAHADPRSATSSTPGSRPEAFEERRRGSSGRSTARAALVRSAATTTRSLGADERGVLEHRHPLPASTGSARSPGGAERARRPSRSPSPAPSHTDHSRARSTQALKSPRQPSVQRAQPLVGRGVVRPRQEAGPRRGSSRMRRRVSAPGRRRRGEFRRLRAWGRGWRGAAASSAPNSRGFVDPGPREGRRSTPEGKVEPAATAAWTANGRRHRPGDSSGDPAPGAVEVFAASSGQRRQVAPEEGRRTRSSGRWPWRTRTIPFVRPPVNEE